MCILSSRLSVNGIVPLWLKYFIYVVDVSIVKDIIANDINGKVYIHVESQCAFIVN